MIEYKAMADRTGLLPGMNLVKLRNRPYDVVRRHRDRVRSKKDRRKWIVSLAAAVVIPYIIFGLIWGIGMVRGESMIPAYRPGDIFFFFRLDKTYDYNDVVLLAIEKNTDYIKRIVALPGDTVDISEDGFLKIDGLKVEESDIFKPTFTKEMSDIQFPLHLGDDEYFVLGDSRDNSRDSRYFGAISRDKIDGKVISLLFRKT